jgi:hypothetical protein
VATYKELRRLRDAQKIAEYFKGHPEHWPLSTTNRTAESWILEYVATQAWNNLAAQHPEGGSFFYHELVDADSNGVVDADARAKLKSSLQTTLGFDVHVAEHAMVDAMARAALKKSVQRSATYSAPPRHGL